MCELIDHRFCSSDKIVLMLFFFCSLAWPAILPVAPSFPSASCGVGNLQVVVTRFVVTRHVWSTFAIPDKSNTLHWRFFEWLAASLSRFPPICLFFLYCAHYCWTFFQHYHHVHRKSFNGGNVLGTFWCMCGCCQWYDFRRCASFCEQCSLRISATVLIYRSPVTGVRMIVRFKLARIFLIPFCLHRIFQLNSHTAMTLLRVRGYISLFLHSFRVINRRHYTVCSATHRIAKRYIRRLSTFTSNTPQSSQQRSHWCLLERLYKDVLGH